MIGRSGSSAGSCVAASQSLRIGRWRWGAEDDCIGGGPLEVLCFNSSGEVCDAAAPNATDFVAGSRCALAGPNRAADRRIGTPPDVLNGRAGNLNRRPPTAPLQHLGGAWQVISHVAHRRTWQ